MSQHEESTSTHDHPQGEHEHDHDHTHTNEDEHDLFEGWDDGAYSAGICDIYYNGELMEEYR